jgi:outer membrane protein OmpA-like peptidoglycan-associated protein
VERKQAEHGTDQAREPAGRAKSSETAAGERGPDQRSLLALQRAAGNAAVTRAVGRRPVDRRGVVQRSPLTSFLETAGHTLAEAVGAEDSFDANLGRAQAFKDHGMFGPRDVIPGTAVAGGGSTGGFEASYDPHKGEFKATIRAAVVFKDGVTMSGNTAVPADPRLTNLVSNLPPPGPRRTAYLARYKWTTAEKTPWLAQLERAIEQAWSAKHEFHVNRPQWEWIGAKVAVDLQVSEQASTGRAANDHLSIDVVKFPQGENLYSAGGTSETGEGSQTSATDQTMLIGSTDVAGRHDNALHSFAIFFDNDSDVLSAAMKTRLTLFKNTYQGAAAGTAGSRPPTIKLEAHTSSSGTAAHNRDLAQRRADAVRAELTAQGLNNVTTRVSDDIQATRGAGGDPRRARRVNLVVDSGEAQVLAAHEFGHAFGLGDEYAVDPGGAISGTGSATGSRADHDPQTKAMTDAAGAHLPGAINENNDNIMSLGNAVQPQHYSTFHTALTQITAIDEWALGPAGPRPTRPAPGSGGSAATPAGTGAATPAPAGP